MTRPDPPALGGSWTFDPQTGARTRVAWTRQEEGVSPVSELPAPAPAADPEPDGEDDQ